MQTRSEIVKATENKDNYVRISWKSEIVLFNDETILISKTT